MLRPAETEPVTTPLFGPAWVKAERQPDGSLLLDHGMPLPQHASSLLERLDHSPTRRIRKRGSASTAGWPKISNSRRPWVNVGVLRVEVYFIKPYAEDVVVTGHGRNTLGLLVFPSIPDCRRVVGDDAANLESRALVQHPAVIDAIRDGLEQHAARQRGSSTRIERFVILPVPPSRERGELTEKGSLNQRAVLTARAANVDVLYQEGHCVDERATQTIKQGTPIC